MCTPDMPDPPPPPPPPAAAPTQVDASVKGAYSRDKKRQRAASGHSSTILTGPMGVQSGGSVGKTVLGG